MLPYFSSFVSTDQDAENLERYIQWADGLVVVYSITSKHSFNYAKNLLQEVSELQKTRDTHEAPVVLVGNKNEMERYRWVDRELPPRVALA